MAKNGHIVQAIENKVGKKPSSILSIVRSPACGEGENFDFDLEAIQIRAKFGKSQEHQFNFVSKSLSFDPDKTKWLLKDFKTEVFVYKEILPAADKARTRVGLLPLSVPKCHLTSVKDQILIMENMKCLGFKMRKAFEDPLTLDEVKSCLQALGSFHASGRHYLNSHPDPGDNLMKSGWLVCRNQFDTLMKLILNVSCLDLMIAEIPDHKKCKAFITNWHNIASRIDSKSNPVRDTLVVDDFWYNNVMFSDSGEVCMLDFQHVRKAWNMVDLVHFFGTSTMLDFRQKYFEESLRSYCDSYNNDLTILEPENKHQKLSLESLKKEFDEAYPLGFVYGLLQAHLDHFGSKDGVEWHEYFTAINDDMSNYYAQVAKEKIKTDQKFKKRLRDLISEAKTKDLF